MWKSQIYKSHEENGLLKHANQESLIVSHTRRVTGSLTQLVNTVGS